MVFYSVGNSPRSYRAQYYTPFRAAPRVCTPFARVKTVFDPCPRTRSVFVEACPYVPFPPVTTTYYDPFPCYEDTYIVKKPRAVVYSDDMVSPDDVAIGVALAYVVLCVGALVALFIESRFSR